MRKHTVVCLLGLVVFCGFLTIGSAGAKSDEPVMFPEFQDEVSSAVSHIYTPVEIFLDGYAHGGGTLVETPQGPRIITDASVFWKVDNQPHLYTFRPLRPEDSATSGISQISLLYRSDQTRVSLVVCTPGSAQPITGLAVEDRLVKKFSPQPIDDRLQSAVSGKFHRVYALLSEQSLCIFDYQPSVEDTGSSFLLDDGALVVLGRGNFVNSEALRRAVPDIPEESVELAYGIVVRFDPWERTFQIPISADVSRPFFKP